MVYSLSTALKWSAKLWQFKRCNGDLTSTKIDCGEFMDGNGCSKVMFLLRKSSPLNHVNVFHLRFLCRLTCIAVIMK